MASKVLPLRDDFENLRALLAHMMETEDAVGFAGVLILSDGTMEPVMHGCDKGRLAYVANVIDEVAMRES